MLGLLARQEKRLAALDKRAKAAVKEQLLREAEQAFRAELES